jgi:hypothetical protein
LDLSATRGGKPADHKNQLTQTPTSAVDQFKIPPTTLFFIIALVAVSLIIVGLKRKNPLAPNSC